MANCRRPNSIRFAALIVLALFLSACSDQALTKLSQALSVTAKSVGALQAVVIQSNAAGSISNDDTAAILNLCARINTAGQEASAVTRQLVKLDPASRRNVLMILQPIVAAVNDAVANGTAGIKNPDVKAKVQSGLLTIQTGLSAAQIVLSATGSK